MNLRTLTHEEFVRLAYAAQDPLTSSDTEAECLRRFEALLNEHDSDLYRVVAKCGIAASALGDVLDTLDAHDLDKDSLATLGDALIEGPDNSAALLAAITEAGLDTPEFLKAELDLAKQFRALVEDAGDVFSRLSQLTITVKE